MTPEQRKYWASLPEDRLKLAFERLSAKQKEEHLLSLRKK